MNKKVIQVPVDEELLITLNHTSRKQNRSRAELIREACEYYLEKVQSEELDRLYQRGYQNLPEELGLGEAQIAIAGEILPGESW